MSLGIVPLKLPYTATQSSNAVLRLAIANSHESRYKIIFVKRLISVNSNEYHTLSRASYNSLMI